MHTQVLQAVSILTFSDHGVIWISYISMQWKVTKFIAEKDNLIMSLSTIFCITFWLHLVIHLHTVLIKICRMARTYTFEILTYVIMWLLSLDMISQFCDVRGAVYRWTPKLLLTTLHVGNQLHDQWRTSRMAEILVLVTVKHVFVSPGFSVLSSCVVIRYA
jgi:hypothetical protein